MSTDKNTQIFNNFWIVGLKSIPMLHAYLNFQIINSFSFIIILESENSWFCFFGNKSK
jgi:hypothetical protein